MTLPYHRGHLSADMNNRSGGYGWGTRDQRVEEANRTLMEQENERKWVRALNASVYDVAIAVLTVNCRYEMKRSALTGILIDTFVAATPHCSSVIFRRSWVIRSIS